MNKRIKKKIKGYFKNLFTVLGKSIVAFIAIMIVCYPLSLIPFKIIQLPVLLVGGFMGGMIGCSIAYAILLNKDLYKMIGIN